jgi:hypothetical protein
LYGFSNISANIPPQTELSPNFYVLNANPFELDDHWKKWLGEIQSEKIEDCNFVILATMASEKTHELDEENKHLSHLVNRYFNLLCLFGTPLYDKGVQITGAHSEDGFEIRQTYSPLRFYRNRHSKPFWISETYLVKTYEFLQKFLSISSGPSEEKPPLIRRGYACRLGALLEWTLEERLHQFVRSIEALLNLKVGQGYQVFAERAQLFIKKTGESKNLLEQIYKIRGRVEHLQTFDDLFAGAEGDVLTSFARKSAQVEIISGYIYRKIFEQADLLEIFSDDASISRFWECSEEERVPKWGQPLDLELSTKEIFMTDGV